MCQAFDGEQEFVMAMEEHCRVQGHRAFRDGAKRDKNPETLPNLTAHWDIGWVLASDNRELW